MALLEAILSELLIIIGVILILYIIFILGRFILGLLANIFLGFIAIIVINLIFNLGIPWDLPVIVITALLGLVGVGVIVVLKLLGVNV